MAVNVQKRLAAQLLKTSRHNVRFDQARLDDIKEAITKADIATLISEGAIFAAAKNGPSKARARKIAMQKQKGRQRGEGSRKGKAGARLPKKSDWINRVRAQRQFIRELRERQLIEKGAYGELYSKIKGGFFRSKRHVKLYITEHKLVQVKK